VNKPEIILFGNGSELNNEKAMQGRAKRKTITQKMILSLVDVAKKKNQPEWVKAYWNTYHCQSEVVSSGGKLYGNYCKNRFCTLCCSIRKADIINRYLPILKQWEDPYFVTLTVKSVKAGKLNYWMNEGIVRGFKMIIEKYRKRSQRGKGFKLMGIKSLECNFNPDRKTYNPHYHIVVPNKEMAEILIKDWMLLWNRKGQKNTVRVAQDMRRVVNKEKVLIEIVKYGSKIFTEPDVVKKSKSKVNRKIYVSALHNIFQAMKGNRIFDRFGFDLPKAINSLKKEPSRVTAYNNWEFDNTVSDWINSQSGKRLTGFSPSGELIELLENEIDIDEY
jgi:hypothetical protein